MSSNINDINNLVFFADDGYMINMLKNYVLTWKIIINNDYVLEAPSGYFIASIKKDGNKIRLSDLQAYSINPGAIIYDGRSTDLDDIEFVQKIYKSNDIKVQISININNKSFSNVFEFSDIFDNIPYETGDNYLKEHVIITANAGDAKHPQSGTYYKEIGIKQFDLKKAKNSNDTYLLLILENNVNDIWKYFPFVRYNGTFFQEKVSANFINTNTFIIYEGIEENNEYKLTRPYFNTTTSDSQYSLLFEPEQNREIKIISTDDLTYEVKYVDNVQFSLADDNSDVPFSFSIGFSANTEGLYNNYVGIYLTSKESGLEGHKFFMGVISINSEVEGEDERFRTLLGNFGVPAPIGYSNLFAELDYAEEGKDYKLINEKSKELFLTYTQIFPYVGTYKALINAIKFLGYDDIIFKEWYTILDSNDNETDIAVLVIDMENNGAFLKLKLAQYGVSIEDFKRYNKINKLSMIYHLNKISDTQYEDTTQNFGIPSLGISTSLKAMPACNDISLVKPIYTYRTDEILAKLFAVKKWLEYNIIGVGAYISDITGEGVYLCWNKSLIYATQHHLADFSSEQYYTPNIKATLPFINSTGKFACTLNEFTALTFDDYKHVPIQAFITNTIPVMQGSSEIAKLQLSNTLQAPVLGNEYQFNLMITPKSGTLYNWSDPSSAYTLLYVADGEIMLLDDKKTTCQITTLPIITLENANIHDANIERDYRKNIAYYIREYTDISTSNVFYSLTDVSTLDINQLNVIKNELYYYILKPNYDGQPELRYTEDNIYNVPMFLFRDFDLYTSDSNKPIITLSKQDYWYILEIEKGDMLFKEINNTGALLSFSTKENSLELDIQLHYTYISEQKPFTNYTGGTSILVNLDSSKYTSKLKESILLDASIFKRDVYELHKNETTTYKAVSTDIAKINSSLLDIALKNDLEIEKLAAINNAINESILDYIIKNVSNNLIIDTSVNHLGEYEIMVKAYDEYGRAYVNKSDKKYEMSVSPIGIQTYVFQNYSNNKEDFYKDNALGETTDLIKVINDSSNNLYPEFPKYYMMGDYTYNINSGIIDYNNISYAVDTPKNNDYLILMNSDAIFSANEFKQLYGSNNKLNITEEHLKIYDLFKLIDNSSDGISNNILSSVNIAKYDKIKREVVSVSDVSNFNDSNTSLNDLYNYIIINAAKFRLNKYDIDTGEQLFLICSSKEQYDLFYLRNSKYEYIIYNDYDNQQCYINSTLNIFNNNDVIKIRYSINNIIDETAYRIIDKIEYYEKFQYILNGIINTNLFNKDGIKVEWMYANLGLVNYQARVVNDGYEYFDMIPGYKGASISKGKFYIDGSNIFLNDYIDNNYTGYISDFDSDYLKLLWINLDSINLLLKEENINIYRYDNFPITINANLELFIHYDEDNNTLSKDNLHIEWALSSKAIEPGVLYENINDKVIFRSINNWLKLQNSENDIIKLRGPLNIELECIDKYGNRLVNKGEGLVYINEN